MRRAVPVLLLRDEQWQCAWISAAPPLSLRAPGVVPLLGEQRVRVAAGHLFALAPPRDYTRGGVRLFAAPAAGRGLTSELVAGVAYVWGWVKLGFCMTSKSLLMQTMF